MTLFIRWLFYSNTKAGNKTLHFTSVQLQEETKVICNVLTDVDFFPVDTRCFVWGWLATYGLVTVTYLSDDQLKRKRYKLKQLSSSVKRIARKKNGQLQICYRKPALFCKPPLCSDWIWDSPQNFRLFGLCSQSLESHKKVPQKHVLSVLPDVCGRYQANLSTPLDFFLQICNRLFYIAVNDRHWFFVFCIPGELPKFSHSRVILTCKLILTKSPIISSPKGINYLGYIYCGSFIDNTASLRKINVP